MPVSSKAIWRSIPPFGTRTRVISPSARAADAWISIAAQSDLRRGSLRGDFSGGRRVARLAGLPSRSSLERAKAGGEGQNQPLKPLNPSHLGPIWPTNQAYSATTGTHRS